MKAYLASLTVQSNRGHIYFRGPPVVVQLFFVRYVYYTLICCVWLV